MGKGQNPEGFLISVSACMYNYPSSPGSPRSHLERTNSAPAPTEEFSVSTLLKFKHTQKYDLLPQKGRLW